MSVEHIAPVSARASWYYSNKNKQLKSRIIVLIRYFRADQVQIIVEMSHVVCCTGYRVTGLCP